MISDKKQQLLYEYDKPIIWNISCFGNEFHMFIIDNLIEILNKYNIKNPITSIHGSYSCKYNGGRTALYHNSQTNIDNKIKHFNDMGIGIKLTFSNRNIHANTFEENEMRHYLDILNETKGIGNGIICVNDDFAELVKKNYPDLDLVASHVKMELETKMGKTDTVDYYNSKFDLYDIVVMNTYRAFDDDFLSKITHPEKVEFIVNHSCSTNCPVAKRHHELIDDLQQRKVELGHDRKKIDKDRIILDLRKEINDMLLKCVDKKEKNILDNLLHQFINKNEINHLINTFGINRFKIEGRDLSAFEFQTSLSRYLTNNESMFDLIHNKTDQKLNNIDFQRNFLD